MLSIIKPPRGKRKKVDPESVSGKIRFLIKNKGLTQARLAEQLGITMIVLNRLLNDKKKYTEDIYIQLERVFNLPKGYFLDAEKKYISSEDMPYEIAWELNKTKKIKNDKSERIRKFIEKICSDNKSPYFLILKVTDSCFIICKKITVNVKKTVETTFSSYDSEDKKTYFVNVILYWGINRHKIVKNGIENKDIKKMWDHGCTVTEVEHPDDLMKILEDIGR